VYLFTRPLVAIALYSIHLAIATSLSQAIRSKCKNDAPQVKYITQAFTKVTVQIISTSKTLLINNVSNVIDSGIDTASTKRSAKATLDNRILEFCFNSLLVFTAIITKRFNRMVTGQAMVVMATKVLKEVV